MRIGGTTMPDMLNRQQFERRLTERLSAVLNRARGDLVNALHHQGFTQGELANVPPVVLDNMRNNLMATLQEELELAYIETAQSFAGLLSFAIGADRLQKLADQWATETVPPLVNSLIETTRASLQDLARRAPSLPLDRRALLGLLGAATLFGLSRAISIARTAATQVNSAAEDAVTREVGTRGSRVVEKWYTKEDERVCPICRPLHEKARGDGWTEPPPAHPNCRCERKYEIIAPDGTVIEVRASEERGNPVTVRS